MLISLAIRRGNKPGHAEYHAAGQARVKEFIICFDISGPILTGHRLRHDARHTYQVHESYYFLRILL